MAVTFAAAVWSWTVLAGIHPSGTGLRHTFLYAEGSTGSRAGVHPRRSVGRPPGTAGSEIRFCSISQGRGWEGGGGEIV